MTNSTIDYGKIFDGTASFYAQFRRAYQTSLFADIIAFYNLSEQTKKPAYIDLGTGTGELAVPLAPFFETVYAVDPSGDMLREAQARAESNDVHNLQFMQTKAEAVDFQTLQPFLVSAAVSFHWMQQKDILDQVYAAVPVGGGFVLVDDNSPVRGKSKTEDWKMKRKEIISKYLGEDRRAGEYLHKDIITEKIPFEDLLKASPFREFTFKKYEFVTKRTIDEIMGFLYSTSYCAPSLFGEALADFNTEMRTELLKLNESGIFIEPGQTRMYLTMKA